MQIGPIALKLRLAETRFENRVFGSAELSLALEYTLKAESAFIVQLGETVNANTLEGSINQLISERFGVICALDNSVSDRDKVGLTAYDRLFDVRAEIFKGILGWQMPGAESLISYGGGRIAGINRAYLWWQLEFLVTTRIDDDDGIDVGADDLEMFDDMYVQWIISPSAKLDTALVGPGRLPVTVVDPDITQIIDFTSNPAVDGGFSKGFGIKFDVYKPE